MIWYGRCQSDGGSLSGPRALPTVLQVADHPEQMLVYFSTDEVPAAKLVALAGEIG